MGSLPGVLSSWNWEGRVGSSEGKNSVLSAFELYKMVSWKVYVMTTSVKVWNGAKFKHHWLSPFFHGPQNTVHSRQSLWRCERRHDCVKKEKTSQFKLYLNLPLIHVLSSIVEGNLCGQKWGEGDEFNWHIPKRGQRAMDPSSFKFIGNHTPLTSPGCTEGTEVLTTKDWFPNIICELFDFHHPGNTTFFLGWLVSCCSRCTQSPWLALLFSTLGFIFQVWLA